MGSASYSDFQVPDTPGLAAGTAPDGEPWVPGNFNSSGLDENQNEQNYYRRGGLPGFGRRPQLTAVGLSGARAASTSRPTRSGDLYFNGVASDVHRRLDSLGVQADASYIAGPTHTLRGRLLRFSTRRCRPTPRPPSSPSTPTATRPGPPSPIADRETAPRGLFAGATFRTNGSSSPGSRSTAGARFDAFDASFDNEDQLSPRVNLIYKPTDSTTLHAGYARYFTPPPVENVSGTHRRPVRRHL